MTDNLHLKFAPRYAEAIEKLSTAIAAAGGRPYLVGGCVRDLVLNPEITPKDIDFEIFGIESEALAEVLTSVTDDDRQVDMVGKQFGVFKVNVNGLEFDVAQPRREVSTGPGHKDFTVVVDSSLTLEEAASRRDLTINAIMCNPLDDYKVEDPFDGLSDLKNGILRPTSPAFKEDPLRPLRAVQMAARLTLPEGVVFKASPDLCEMSKELSEFFPELSEERISVEWEKWAKGNSPTTGLQTLIDIGWSDLFPTLSRALASAQESARGLHSLSLDALSAAYPLSTNSERHREALLMAQVAVSSQSGLLPASRLLEEFVLPVSSHSHFSCLVSAYSELASLSEEDIKDVDVLARQLSLQLEKTPFEVSDLIIMARINMLAPDFIAKVYIAAHEEGVLDAPMLPLIQGRDLLAAGYPAGPLIGRILKHALGCQVRGEFTTKEDCLRTLSIDYPLFTESQPPLR